MNQRQQDISYNMNIMKEAFEGHVEEMGTSLKLLEASDKEFRSTRGKGKVYTPVAESEYKEFKDLVWAKFRQWETALNKYQRETPTRGEVSTLQAAGDAIKEKEWMKSSGMLWTDLDSSFIFELREFIIRFLLVTLKEKMGRGILVYHGQK